MLTHRCTYSAIATAHVPVQPIYLLILRWPHSAALSCSSRPGWAPSWAWCMWGWPREAPGNYKLQCNNNVLCPRSLHSPSIYMLLTLWHCVLKRICWQVVLGFAMLGPRGTLGLCPRGLSCRSRHPSREPTGPDVLFVTSLRQLYILVVGLLCCFIV